MDEKERAIRLRFMQDFEFYAPRCLKIKPAAGGLVPLAPTEQQKKLHAVAERQLREKGRVRIIVAKGRKTKTSTYVQGRFFWKVTHRKGTQAYVIAHDKKTTDEIFSMADRFYRHCPPLLRPTASQNSVTSMKFEEIDSDYAVGTAGSLNVGRGYSPQLLHGCLGPDTLVVGKNGFVYPITAPPEFVRDGNGRLIRVIGISETDHSGETALRISTSGNAPFPLTLTKDHKVLCRGERGEAEWRRADEVEKNDFIAFPRTATTFGKNDSLLIPQLKNCIKRPSRFPLTRETGEFAGWYLAEGSAIRNTNGNLSGINLACDRDEAEHLIRMAEAAVGGLCTSISRYDCKTSRTTSIAIYGRQLAEFVVERFGELEWKMIPDAVWNYPRAFVDGLICGLILGDGCIKNIRQVNFTTTRPQLAMQLKRLAVSMRYGHVSITVTEAGFRHNRNEKERWVVSFFGPANVKLRRMMGLPLPPRCKTLQAYIDRRLGCDRERWGYGRHDWRRGKNHYWARVSKVEEVPAPEKMYDLVLEKEPHSFTTACGVAHNSELGFWPKGEEIARGLITAVADEPGTEVWLESTGNGPGDYFHSQVMAALAGQSDYEVVFLEWWLEPEYSSDEPISPTEKEQELLKSYPGLTLGNLAWRRKRIASYGGDKRAEMLFTREYPMSIAEVFSQAEGSFIEPELVADAAKRQPDDVPGGSVVVGIDPGGGGEDPTGLIARKGGHLFYVENLHEADPDTLAGKLIKRLEELQPKATFVDNIGVGYHLVGKLSAKIPGVRGIDFRRTAIEEQRFANKRAESYSNLKEWLKTASIPDNELLKIELSAFKYKYRANGQLEIESKDKARERGVKSPNLADAAALSLSEPVEQSQLDDTLWNIWPFKPRKWKVGAENLPDCNFITAYAWLSDEQWAIAAVGVFVPDTDRMKQADQKTELPNAIILKYVTGDGPYHFMDACHKLYKLYEPDYFYVPTRATILMKDLRIKNLTIRRAKFDTVGDVVAAATDVLKDRVGWVRNTSSGHQLIARLARYPHGTDEALYGCIGLALAHLKQRGDIAVQFEEPEEPPRRRRDRRTAY